jgi:tetratricopeptide (TPR) repeat protein
MTTTGMLASLALVLLSRCVGLDAPAPDLDLRIDASGFSVEGRQSARAALLDARTLAYNANARNDAAGLRRALDTFERLAGDDEAGLLPAYYASWTAWSLAGSHVQAGATDAAKTSVTTAVRYARQIVARQPEAVEFQTMLANAAIGLAVIDSTQFQALVPEIGAARKKALALGPRNPRAVMMDAGMIFNIPPERGGSQEKGIARWIEALALFDEEAAVPPKDDLQPRWGRDLAHGWLAAMYLRLTPPAIDKARAAADKALALRPDFWFVKEVVLPKLQDAR